jgi:hypothetical protein
MLPPAPNDAVRRFRRLIALIPAIRIAALLGLLAFLALYFGGH